MRVTSGLWVAALLRRVAADGAFIAVERRGAEAAGAIFIKAMRLDRTGRLIGPAPQTAYDAEADRRFVEIGGLMDASESEIDARLAREARFDPDIWIVTIEDREGRDFLGADLTNDPDAR